MGHGFADVELEGRRRGRLRMLVDTGATHTLIPSDVATRLGITPLPRRVKVELANGTRASMRIGAVIVRLMGREAGDTVLIGRRGVEPILGVEALEALGLMVDPGSKKIRPSRARAVLLVSIRTRRGAGAGTSRARHS